MRRTLTRRDFIKVAGAGTAGLALLGSAGCESATRVPAGLPSDYLPTGGSRMNVVLIIVDSLRKDHVGVYGNDWIETPNLDALARDSLRFEHAYPESVPSIPARRGFHTGIRAFPFRDWQKWSAGDVGLWGWQPIPREQTTLAEILQTEGYYNMFVTDTLHQFRPFYDFHRGFHAFHWIRGQERDLYKPRSTVSEGEIERVLIGGPNASRAREIMRQYLANTSGRGGEEDWFTPQVFSSGMNFLEAAREEQPFFLLVDNYDPHEPWDPPEKYVSLYSDGYDGPEPMIASSGSSDWLEEEQLERMRALYAGEVSMVDRWLGRFLDKMEELDLFESTLIILLSDHGHAFGEHGYAGKVPAAMYPELMDLVFFVRHPEGKKAGEGSDYYASTHDIAPTVLGSLGMETPGVMEGQDLTVLLEDGEPGQERSHFSASYHDRVWARDDRYVLMARNDGAEAKLFDLRSDPQMNRDVASANPEIVRRMYDGYVVADAGGPLPRY
jgi:arylsulfatase A-like enzyme